MTSFGTAVRPRWDQLPAPLRHGLAARLGGIAGADVQTGGFAPGLAARLVLADGGRVFVKGIAADHALAGNYRAEAQVAHALPDAVPAPRLRWAGRGADDLTQALHFIDIARSSGTTDSPMQRVRLDTAHGHFLLSGTATLDGGLHVLDQAAKSVANAESAKPYERASSGSMSTSTRTALQSAGTPWRARPLTIATRATATITAARSTLGDGRASSPAHQLRKGTCLLPLRARSKRRYTTTYLQ